MQKPAHLQKMVKMEIVMENEKDKDKNKTKNNETAKYVPKKKKENLNAGHRERMRARYLAAGLDSFEPHEVMELLLFYAQPHKDMNKVAHRLIHEFHTVAGVLDAAYDDLIKIEGVGKNIAVFLKMMPELFRTYELSKFSDRIEITKNLQFKRYLKSLYIGIVHEQAYLLCKDAQDRIISVDLLSEGVINSVDIDVRTITQIALRNRCSSIILVHNHPDGVQRPSLEDLHVTRYLFDILKPLQIILSDHYIVAGDEVISLRRQGYWAD